MHKTGKLVRNRYHGMNYFTFSQLYFDQYGIAADGIQNFGNSVIWYVSSPRVYFLENLLRGLKRAGCLSLGKVRMPIEDIEVLGDPDIGEVMEFSCMSPITITSCPNLVEERPRYGRIEDYDFTEKLRLDLINKFYRIYDSLPVDENLEFEFNQRYIENKRRVSRLVEFNGIKILGYMIPFLVKGNPELIRLGYQLGFGNRNNCGFGMVKVWYPPVGKQARLENDLTETSAI
jgi:CRISPR-associated endoribonuclease Cas6